MVDRRLRTDGAALRGGWWGLGGRAAAGFGFGLQLHDAGGEVFGVAVAEGGLGAAVVQDGCRWLRGRIGRGVTQRRRVRRGRRPRIVGYSGGAREAGGECAGHGDSFRVEGILGVVSGGGARGLALPSAVQAFGLERSWDCRVGDGPVGLWGCWRRGRDGTGVATYGTGRIGGHHGAAEPASGGTRSLGGGTRLAAFGVAEAEDGDGRGQAVADARGARLEDGDEFGEGECGGVVEGVVEGGGHAGDGTGARRECKFGGRFRAIFRAPVTTACHRGGVVADPEGATHPNRGVYCGRLRLFSDFKSRDS